MRHIKVLLAALPLAAAGMLASAAAMAEPKHGFRGGHGHHGHGRWHGGHHRWHGRWHGPRIGLYFGAPLVLGSYWWGHPGYAWYDEPRVVYREVIREPEVIEYVEPAPTTEIPRGEGTPTQGPMHMNYCESAKAYFPKVTRCPEGWKLTGPTQ